MEPRFIYRNLADARFYDASKGEMRGGPDKVIVYIDGLLVAMDRDAKIIIPMSRWKLAEIGLACFLAALKGKGAAPRSLEAVPVPEPPPALPESAEPAENQLPNPLTSICCAASTTKRRPRNLHSRKVPKHNGSVSFGKCATYLENSIPILRDGAGSSKARPPGLPQSASCSTARMASLDNPWRSLRRQVIRFSCYLRSSMRCQGSPIWAPQKTRWMAQKGSNELRT
jgi:hypothetical protein